MASPHGHWKMRASWLRQPRPRRRCSLSCARKRRSASRSRQRERRRSVRRNGHRAVCPLATGRPARSAGPAGCLLCLTASTRLALRQRLATASGAARASTTMATHGARRATVKTDCGCTSFDAGTKRTSRRGGRSMTPPGSRTGHERRRAWSSFAETTIPSAITRDGSAMLPKKASPCSPASTRRRRCPDERSLFPT